MRPAVAGVSTPRLGPDVVAIAADQRPLLGLDPDVGEPVGESEIVELPNRVGLEVDPDPLEPDRHRRFEDADRYPDLMEREGRGQPADAATRDNDRLAHLKPVPSIAPSPRRSVVLGG